MVGRKDAPGLEFGCVGRLPRIMRAESLLNAIAKSGVKLFRVIDALKDVDAVHVAALLRSYGATAGNFRLVSALAGLPAEALAEAGGAVGDRTPDLRNAIATLSQLSYGPTLPRL